MRSQRLACGVVCALILTTITLGACTPSRVHTERAHREWSRGVLVGTGGLNDRSAMAVSPSGDWVWIAWVGVRQEDGRLPLQWARLGSAAELVITRALDISTVHPAQIELQYVSPQELRLWWLDVDKEGLRRLYTALVDADGELLQPPVALSPRAQNINSFSVSPAGDASSYVAWSTQGEGQRDLFYAQLDREGAFVRPPRSLQRPASSLALRRDGQGRLHLVWQEIPDYGRSELYYGQLTDEGKLTETRLLSRFSLSVGVVFWGPAVGLTDDQVHVFWSLERRGGGLARPGAYCFETRVLLQPSLQVIPAHQVVIPALNHPNYRGQALAGARQVATVPPEALGSDFVYQPASVQRPSDPLPVAFSVQIAGRTKRIIQIVVAYYSLGELQGYQIAAKTASSSLKPTLLADGRGNLHLTWIDAAGFGVYRIYYATTTQAARQRLNRWTWADIGKLTLDVLWGIFQALSFLPILFAWCLAPVTILVLYVFIKAEDSLAYLSTRIALWGALVVYILSKYLLRPNWLLALPVPHTWAMRDVFIFATPVAISLVSALVLRRYRLRAEEPSLFPAFGLFVLTDTLLTLLIYVPAILAE